jgi:hypothetical protein
MHHSVLVLEKKHKWIRIQINLLNPSMRIDIFVRNDIFMQIFCTIHATTQMSSFPQCSKTHGNFLSLLQSFAPNTSLLFYNQVLCTERGHQSLFGLYADSK